MFGKFLTEEENIAMNVDPEVAIWYSKSVQESIGLEKKLVDLSLWIRIIPE